MSSTSALVLDGPATAAALDPVEVLAAVRGAMVAISDDAVSAPPRIFARTPNGILGCMPAFVPGVGLAAKLVSVFEVPGADGHRGRSTHFGLVALFDETDGRPLVIMEAGRLTAVRTAAAATLSMQALAPDPARIAIIGTGVQARAQLELLTALSTPADVVIGARDLDAGHRLAATAPGAGVEPIRDAVHGADVVFCCTGATEPVIQLDWLSPHAHVSSVGGSQGHEVDAATVAAAAVWVEWLGAADQPPPAGAHELQGVDLDRVRLLGSVLGTDTPPDRAGRTLFKSTGHAAFDVAAASVAHRLARERGLGSPLVF